MRPGLGGNPIPSTTHLRKTVRSLFSSGGVFRGNLLRKAKFSPAGKQPLRCFRGEGGKSCSNPARPNNRAREKLPAHARPLSLFLSPHKPLAVPSRRVLGPPRRTPPVEWESVRHPWRSGLTGSCPHPPWGRVWVRGPGMADGLDRLRDDEMFPF